MTRQYGTLIDLYLQELFEHDYDAYAKYQKLDQDLNQIFGLDDTLIEYGSYND